MKRKDIEACLYMEGLKDAGPEKAAIIRMSVLSSVSSINHISVNVRSSCAVIRATCEGSSFDEEDVIGSVVGCIDTTGVRSGENPTIRIENTAAVPPPVVLYTLGIEGMMCQKNCGSTVEGALRAALPPLADDGCCPPGGCLLHATASFADAKAYAWVLFEEGIENDAANSLRARIALLLEESIEACGFDAELIDCSDGMPSQTATEAAAADLLAESQAAAGALSDDTLAENYSALDIFDEGDVGQQPRSDDAIGDARYAGSTQVTASTDADALADMVIEVGITGMSCAACVGAISRGLLAEEMSMRGLRSAQIGLLTEKAVIHFSTIKGLTADGIMEEIEGLGYGAYLISMRRVDGGDEGHGKIGVYSLVNSYGDPGPNREKRDQIDKMLKEATGVADVYIDPSAQRLLVRVAEQIVAPAVTVKSAVVVIRGLRDVIELLHSHGHTCEYLGIATGGDSDPSGYGDTAITFDDDGQPVACGSLERQARNILSNKKFQLNASTNDEETSGVEESPDLVMWRRLMRAALVLGLPVIALHMWSMNSRWAANLFDTPENTVCGGGVTRGQLLMLALNTPLQFGVGYRFYRAAYMSARHGNYGMDCLVVTGTTITFVYSFLQMLRACIREVVTTHVFFEVSGMLLTFVTLGKYMEAYSRGSTMAAVAGLLAMQPKNANLVHGWPHDGLPQSRNEAESIVSTLKTEMISTELLQKGDVVCVEPGHVIPADGNVTFGASHVDESMITGESTPVSKVDERYRQLEGAESAQGSYVFGSTSNISSRIYVRVSTPAEESALAQIAKLVETAQMTQSPTQALADRVASVFTPIVIGLALITFGVWNILCATGMVPEQWYVAETGGDPILFSLLFGISVVVISCPCALGLATPMAIMVGTTVAAECGMLIKGGKAFEDAHAVRTVVFDKTGTLTEGFPVVKDVILTSVDGNYTTPAYSDAHNSQPSRRRVETDALTTNAYRAITPAVLLMLAATAEQASTHPLGKAILRANEARCKEENEKGLPDAAMPSLLTVTQESAFSEETGRGVSCCLPIDQHNELLRMLQDPVVSSESVDPLERRNTQIAPKHGNVHEPSTVWTIRVGNRALLESAGITITPLVDSRMVAIEETGQTAVAVTYGSRVLGLLAIADPVKPHARVALNYLRFHLGLDVWMATGDSPATAAAIAKQLDLPRQRVIAAAMPRTKVRLIELLKVDGLSDFESSESDVDGVEMGIMSALRKHDTRDLPIVGDSQQRTFVCMVGDGINDSPALAAADVGIAMGAGAQAALDAADCILVSDDIRGVTTCLALARTVFRRVQMNFVWALAYNVVAIPFAAGIWYPWTRTAIPPQYAGLSMALSSLSVVASSMALRCYKRPSLGILGDMKDGANSMSVGTPSHIPEKGLRDRISRGLTSLGNRMAPESVRDSSSVYNPLSVDEDMDASIHMGESADVV